MDITELKTWLGRYGWAVAALLISWLLIGPLPALVAGVAAYGGILVRRMYGVDALWEQESQDKGR